MARRILIVSNSYHPEISPRAFRTVELARELARRGDEVTVVLPNRERYRENPLPEAGVAVLYGTGAAEKDGCGNVHRNGRIRRFLPRFLQKAILYFFNHEYFFKYDKGLYERLRSLDEKFDAVISISYPAAIHRAVYEAMRKNHALGDAVKIAEYSDPPFRSEMVPRVFPFYYCRLRQWGRVFDWTVVPVAEAVNCYTPYIDVEKIKVIPQGFDMTAIKRVGYKPHAKPTFAYAGRFYENIRDPRFFFDFLKGVQSDFSLDLYLNHLDPYFQDMIAQAQKQSKGEITILDPLPREELLEKLSGYDFLVNFENVTSGALPSKLIDYALTGRPVFSFGEDNFDPEKFGAVLKGDYSGRVPDIDIEDYDIRNVADKFYRLFDSR